MSARVRDRLGWTILVLAVVAGLSTQLAIGSGQALQHTVKNSTTLEHHIAIAESIRPLALLLFLAAFGIMLVDRRARSAWPFRERRAVDLGPAAKGALVAVVVVVALATCVRLYQIGDSGAKATWDNTRIVSASASG